MNAAVKLMISPFGRGAGALDTAVSFVLGKEGKERVERERGIERGRSKAGREK